MSEIFDHDNFYYKVRWQNGEGERWNGAYYYSREIVRNIIPNVDTDRNWVTAHSPTYSFDHSVFFIHNNLEPDRYSWLWEFEDQVLVCGAPETVGKVKHLGKAIYLPLSIDTKEVRRYKLPKEERHGTCFVGRPTKAAEADIPEGTDILSGLQREELLPLLAQYEKAYAIGRCAIEARCLGLEVLPYDPRYPDPKFWKVSDNLPAARRLQKMLDEIDGIQR